MIGMYTVYICVCLCRCFLVVERGGEKEEERKGRGGGREEGRRDTIYMCTCILFCYALGTESHQLLEKITALEQERLSFVTKIDELSEQNKGLWMTVSEMVSVDTVNVVTQLSINILLMLLLYTLDV